MRGSPRAAWLLRLGAFIVALAVQATALHSGLQPLDEGTILVGADRVLHGEIPFRDFYTYYPPGQYYTVAALFWLFGCTTTVARLYDAVMRALIVVMLAELASRQVGRGWGALVALAGAIWLAAVRHHLCPVSPSLFWAVTALSLLGAYMTSARGAAGPKPLLAVLTGGALALSLCYRHDVGAFALVAVAAALVATLRLTLLAPGTALRSALLVAGGLTAGLGPIILAFAAAGTSLSDVSRQLVRDPLLVCVAFRRVPLPRLSLPTWSQLIAMRLDELASALSSFSIDFGPPVIAAGIACAAWLLLTRRSAPERWARDASFCGIVVLGTLCLSFCGAIADPIHLLPALVLSYLVLAALVRRWCEGHGAALKGLGIGAGVLLAGVSLVSPILRGRDVSVQHFPFSWERRTDLPRSPNLRPLWARARVAAFLREKVPIGGRIFVGSLRHDRIYANEPIIYFLAERLPATPYHFLDPGVADTAAVQSEIVAGIERYQVEYVVRSSAFVERIVERGQPGSCVLDDYLEAHFVPCREFSSQTSVWCRRKGVGRTASR
jgi:hypothetical protein